MKSRKDILGEHSSKLSDYYEFIHQIDLEPIKLKRKVKEKTRRSVKRKLSRILVRDKNNKYSVKKEKRILN